MTHRECALSSETIDEISESLRGYLDEGGCERRLALRIQLTVEELLLRIRDEFDTVTVSMGRRFGRHYFSVRYDGTSCDPTVSFGDDQGGGMLAVMGLAPAWSYRRGTNVVSLELPRMAKRSALATILISAGLAVLLGALGSQLLPGSVRDDIDTALLSPIISAYLGLLRIFGTLMIAFTVCSGVLGVGDTGALGRLGGSVFLRLLLNAFVICVLAVVVSIPYLRDSYAGGLQGQVSQLGAISEIVFDVFPSNLSDVFRDNNSIQVIVLALFVGVGLLTIGERGAHLQVLVTEAATLTQRVVTLICKAVPLLVFCMLLRQALVGDTDTVLTLWSPLLLVVALNLVLAAAYLLLTSLSLRYPMGQLWGKVTRPVVTALSTASSMSSLALSMETCERKLGVDADMVSFVYPLGTVLFKPGTIVFFTVITCFYTSLYNVQVDIAWIVMAVFTIVLLTVAMPPIPGAGTIVYTVLFAQLGIPADALALSTVLSVVTDYIDTALSVMLLILQVTREAQRLQRLDREVLSGSSSMGGA